ncbi:MAG: hypothetical protein R3C32_15585 [Chloroflexota bacterium]
MGTPDVVVQGAAAWDIDDADPRGWRLGGGVTYGASLRALWIGLRIGRARGAGPAGPDAHELGLLEAGVDPSGSPLASGPVFHNVEPLGSCPDLSPTAAPVSPTMMPGMAARAVPPGARRRRGGADLVGREVLGPDAVVVVFGWQGVLAGSWRASGSRRCPPRHPASSRGRTSRA